MSADSIYALSSGAGHAGVAVIRVSGPAAGAALQRLTARALPKPRRATAARLLDPAGGGALDDGLVLWLPGPASATGEDVAELHVHGGPAVVAAVLRALSACDGLRLAEPGEFTRRAFVNGRIDLTAAEGIADLVAAETEAQRRQALRQSEGALAALYEGWRDRLLNAMTRQEAALDFSDQDLPDGLVDEALRTVVALDREIGRHLTDGGRGERLRAGLSVAIVGAPNAGKSSLLNALSRRDAAIVAAEAGTTRDVIEVHMDLGGFPVMVADTAGLRSGVKGVEREGVRRAEARARDADLKLAVFDRAGWPAIDAATAALVDDDTLVVLNKIDLGATAGPAVIADRPALPVSALTGEGLPALEAALGREVAARCDVAGAPLLTRHRHREALEQCRTALARFVLRPAPELAAEELRLAADALGRLTGRVDVEELLDRIFRDFCVGK